MTKYSLVVSFDGKQVVEHPLPLGVSSLGRHPSNSLQLDGTRVSRFHATLTVGPDGSCRLQDAGSRNGTLINGIPVQRTLLQAGECFSVGEFACELRASERPDDKAVPLHETAGDMQNLVNLANVGDVPQELFLGCSSATQDLLRLVRRAAITRVSVLITGESGSGKGVVGRLLHHWSSRSQGPFVVVNCAAIPGELVESELFGHRKGSFTGAVSDRVGKFQAADKGTLFLDEIGDMTLAAQAKILRAIEDQQIEQVGNPRPISVDVRVVAATNRDLERAIAERRFRQDLYFRLSTVSLRVPPLRARPDDIVLLANHFLGELMDEIPSARGSRFAPSAFDALRLHDWPGNVRELRNVVAQALILNEDKVIAPEHLRLPNKDSRQPAATQPSPPPGSGSLEDVEAHHIRSVLERRNWNITHAADELGITRKTLRRRMDAIGIERPTGSED